jgi:hypothetical protein
VLGNACSIIMGDKDLRVLHGYEAIEMYRPKEWLEYTHPSLLRLRLSTYTPMFMI